ncbi:MAG TPA: histidine phosphatase family protein, partial [Xanthomonadaceae bacterium]|nr:histidine phosphatase family protein [Xanthomonadaceae bacterium]
MGSLLLIRHGQASFGAADYDQLSPAGEEQSRKLGAWLKSTGQLPDLIAVGPLRRHVRTADLCIEEAGVTVPRISVAGLDEIDHEQVLARHRPDLAASGALVAELARTDDPHRMFQRLYVASLERWCSGEFDHQYTRTWTEFRAAVMGALQALAAHQASTIWAFTSGGPIAVVVNALVGAPLEQAFSLSWPLVNTSLSRVALSARRSTLISYNA